MGIKKVLISLIFLVSCSSQLKEIQNKSLQETQKYESTEFISVSLEQSVNQTENSLNAAQSVLDAINAPTETIIWNEFDPSEIINTAQLGKLSLIYFYLENCDACNKTEKETFNDPDIINLINQYFYSIKADVEKSQDLSPLFTTNSGVVITPTILIIMPNGTLIRLVGYFTAPKLHEIIIKIVGINKGWTTAKL